MAMLPLHGNVDEGPLAGSIGKRGVFPATGVFHSDTGPVPNWEAEADKTGKAVEQKNDVSSVIDEPREADVNEEVFPRSDAQRLIIADDHVLFSDALECLIRNAWPTWTVDHVVSLPDLWLKIEASNHYDIILLDLRMPGMDGPQCIAPIVQFSSEAKVILMSGLATAAEIAAAINQGVAGFIPKNESGLNFLSALKRLVEAEPGQARHSALKEMEVGQLSKLSPRELDTARHMALGLSNKEIAMQLGISPATVKVYSKSIMMKFGVRNRTEFAGEAIRLGFV